MPFGRGLDARALDAWPALVIAVEPKTGSRSADADLLAGLGVFLFAHHAFSSLSAVYRRVGMDEAGAVDRRIEHSFEYWFEQPFDFWSLGISGHGG